MKELEDVGIVQVSMPPCYFLRKTGAFSTSYAKRKELSSEAFSTSYVELGATHEEFDCMSGPFRNYLFPILEHMRH